MDDLNIRYVKLHFYLEMLEDTELPAHKASALRGGMGEMLLRANCVRDKKCEACDFENECIVRRTMYSKMEIEPAFMSAGDSVGYVLECEDYRTKFYEGDTLQFNLILFGKTIVYFSQYMNAFYALGMNGLGKNHSHFRVAAVTNTKGQPILEDRNVLMKHYEIRTVNEYVRYREAAFKEVPAEITLRVRSPLALKFRGKELTELNGQALMEALFRRVYMLNCFEGHEAAMGPDDRSIIPEIVEQHMHLINVPRYSFRKESKMVLKGFEGEAALSRVTQECFSYLLAGELIHIGKNTSFGFGRYRVKEPQETQ